MLAHALIRRSKQTYLPHVGRVSIQLDVLLDNAEQLRYYLCARRPGWNQDFDNLAFSRARQAPTSRKAFSLLFVWPEKGLTLRAGPWPGTWIKRGQPPGERVQVPTAPLAKSFLADISSPQAAPE
jgi:hypothetical protein